MKTIAIRQWDSRCRDSVSTKEDKSLTCSAKSKTEKEIELN